MVTAANPRLLQSSHNTRDRHTHTKIMMNNLNQPEINIESILAFQRHHRAMTSAMAAAAAAAVARSAHQSKAENKTVFCLIFYIEIVVKAIKY